MAYLFRQKLQISELVDLEQKSRRILVHEPEEYLSGLYEHYLKTHNFDVKACPHLELLKDFSQNFSPDLLVFNIEGGAGSSSKVSWLINFKRSSSNVLVITTGFNTGGEVLKKLISVGVSSHINRRLGRPQDLVVLAKSLLNY